jgi:FkbM family methyltransferase
LIQMQFVDRDGNQVDVDFEKEEQFLVRKYIPADGTVLEMGARYGTVSCAISEILQDKSKHVAVEPDASVIEALTKNRNSNNAGFRIYNGVVSRYGYDIHQNTSNQKYAEYGTYTQRSDDSTLNHMSLDELESEFKMKFDCVVADCEGFFYDFVKENGERLKNMRVLIYEQDGIPWNEMIEKYNELDEIFKSYGFKLIHTIPHPKYENNPRFHNVWVKE